ncbi:MAG: hypothetical protein K6D94_11900 [Clostridiales bacterium]|nr:hypothetical protein [Clostridiales bacterium]
MIESFLLHEGQDVSYFLYFSGMNTGVVRAVLISVFIIYSVSMIWKAGKQLADDELYEKELDLIYFH